MPSDGRPGIYTIAAHRAFADALALGLIDDFADGELGLARTMVLLPNNRARSAVQAAFVRAGGEGLLLPRLVVIGDAELDEGVGLALDSLDMADPIPPAIDPLRRRMMLASLIARTPGRDGEPISGAASFQLAGGLARVIDQLHYEEISPRALIDLDLSAFAEHWQVSLEQLRLLVDDWPALLASTGQIDRADRQNRLLARVTAGWIRTPPASFIVAAGISTAAPAIARLLRVVARLPRGMVVLPGLDLGMNDEEWDALGPVPGDGDASSRRALAAHPQYHLKLLLARMGTAREEVQDWAATSPFDGPAARDPFASLLFAPARFTARWQQASGIDQAVAGISGAIFADDGQEAQGIALAMRAVLEQAGQTAALVTPDRQLAARVASALRRWGINVDDSAGQPLHQSVPGTLLLQLAALATEFDTGRLIALLGHPLVRAGADRRIWVDQVRRLDLLLRDPGLQPGWDGITARLAERFIAARPEQQGELQDVQAWWADASAALQDALAPLLSGAPAAVPALLGAMQTALGWLAGDGVWTGAAGRALGQLFDRWALVAGDGPALVSPQDFCAMLAEILAGETVRPPYGDHPRLFIWGLLEARLQRADLMILGGLDEGRWPPEPSPDPWLAPGIRRALGLGAPERQQGLSAHDFAGALGGQRILITRAQRGGDGPTSASRFWLRLTALAGDLPPAQVDGQSLTALAAMLDVPPGEAEPAGRPQPDPSADQRPGQISVTGVDQLAKDPYAFYAAKILRLRALDPLSSGPDARWLGTRIHKLLEDWQKDGATAAGLETQLAQLADDPALDALARAFWLPRIAPSLRWAAETVWANMADGRIPIASEVEGHHKVCGILLTGKADRIDRLTDGSLAIVDYKSGAAPSAKAAYDKRDNQLGLLGMMAEMGQMDKVEAGPIAALEYWSIKPERSKGIKGAVKRIFGNKVRLKTAEQAVASAHDALAELTALYLTGTGLFTPGDAAGRYRDFDQLMRRDEWFGRDDSDAMHGEVDGDPRHDLGNPQ